MQPEGFGSEQGTGIIYYIYICMMYVDISKLIDLKWPCFEVSRPPFCCKKKRSQLVECQRKVFGSGKNDNKTS